MATPSSMVIEELSGPRRTIVLRGRALPRRPVRFARTQRYEKTTPQGNPVASFQIVGPTEDETEMTGVWNDRFLGSVTPEGYRVEPTAVALLGGRQVADAGSLVALFDNLMGRGSMCRVTWDEHVRIGLLAHFAADWDRAEDCEWTMRWDWGSRGEELPVIAVRPNTLGRVQATLATRTQALYDAIAPATTLGDGGRAAIGIAKAVLDKVRAVEQTVGSYVAAVDRALGAIADGVLQPAEAALQIVDSLRSVESSVTDMIATLGGQASAALAHGRQSFTGLAATGSEADAVAGQGWRGEVTSAGRALSRSCARSRGELETYDGGDLLAVYVATEDDDLRYVAHRFYGNPDLWRFLASYNNLSASRLAAGQYVYVPQETRGAAA